MKSRRPKVLHAIAGRPMLHYVADAITGAGISNQVVVASPEGSEEITGLLSNGARLSIQQEPLGTGHALMQTRTLLEGRVGHVLVVNGDLPLILSDTLRQLVQLHLSTESVMTFLACPVSEPLGLGRVVRDSSGRVVRVVEEAEATSSQKEIKEVCCGAYCFDGAWLWKALEMLPQHSNQEVYLTDLAEIAADSRNRVETAAPSRADEVIGVNDRQDLARVTNIAYERTREHWMRQGVTLIDPKTIYIDHAVRIGMDTIVHPHTALRGSTAIGEGCEIGPQSIIEDSRIGDYCRIQASVVEGSTLEDHVEVGPFSHLRPGAYLGSEVHLGNYVEVKKSRLGKGTRVGHFTYLGDAVLEAGVNIGAGTITCNYDGVRKNETYIGEGAFIGCDSMLVAPVKIGARAVTGAGAVVTHDVPPDTTVAGVPARVLTQSPMPENRKSL